MRRLHERARAASAGVGLSGGGFGNRVGGRGPGWQMRSGGVEGAQDAVRNLTAREPPAGRCRQGTGQGGQPWRALNFFWVLLIT